MQNFPKLGLPIIFLIGAIVILISKTAVTIGPGEGGVLFERLETVLILNKHTEKGFI